MKPELVIKGPVLSEKSVLCAEKNTYGLKVSLKATKPEIKAALKEVFDVDAVKIRTLITRGDAARRMRSKGSSSSALVKKANVKKAYVQLKAGQTLPTPTMAEDAVES